MNCERIDELLSDALDGPLEAADRATVDAHLAACPACVDNLRAYVTTQAILRDIGREEPETAPLADDLVRRILDARRESAKTTRRTA